MRYKRENIIVKVGEWTRVRISDNSVFVGRPTEEQLIEWGFKLIEEHIPTQQELLEQARFEKLIALEEYDNSDNVNSFTLNGNPMWLDYPTRQQLRTSIEAYQSQGIEQVTKWFGGMSYTFPTVVWLQMLNALEVYASEALNATEAHRAAINALTSIEEIDEYDFTIGYPKKIEL